MYRPAVSLGRIIFTTCETEINAKVLFQKYKSEKSCFQEVGEKKLLNLILHSCGVIGLKNTVALS